MATDAPRDDVVDVTIEAESLNTVKPGTGNLPERLDWFQDQALGMFIHWGLDCLIGTVPSHWMIGADPALVDRFIADAPTWFNPRHFVPEDYARLARQAGMRYACFTTKHHSGFCMFATGTTHFNVLATPYGQDITREFVQAFHHHGIGCGLYFSPLDFHWCHTHGKPLHFYTPDVLPANNPDLMAYNKAQVEELMHHYGHIDMMFFDGPPEELRELAWQHHPHIVVTRGALQTPEQHLPDTPLPGVWEACCTIGDGWSYKPTNDTVKSGADLIRMLIRTRALGGNLLLNVTPDPDGRIPTEQERVLQELGTWLFFNGEAIYAVRPWRTPRHGDTWFTRAKDTDTVNAFITGQAWPHGLNGRSTVTIQGVHTTPDSTIEMVGQTPILEHSPDADTQLRWHQDDAGIHIDAMRCYRPYDNRQWPNPVVFRITHAT